MAPSTGSAVGQSLFTPISHPQLRRLGRKNIHVFLRERENYLLCIADAQAIGSTIQPISLKASIDRDLLLSLVEFGEFAEVTSLANLTEDNLKAWLGAKEKVSLESLSLQELETAIKSNIRINVNEPDPEMRIKGLFMDFKTFLRTKMGTPRGIEP